MAYFKIGLDIDGLKAEYRVLAKKYHPDLNGGKTTAEMQAINAEYDAYYDRLVKPQTVNVWDFTQTAEQSREFIIFMVKDANGRLYAKQMDKYNDFYRWFGSMFVRNFYPAKSWTNAKPGFAKVHSVGKLGDTDLAQLVVGESINTRLPDLGLMHRYLNNMFWCKRIDYPSLAKIEIEGQEYYVSTDHRIFGQVGDRLVIGEYFGKMPVSTFSTSDLPFLAYQDCTYQEFKKYHDCDYISEFHHTLQMKPIDGIGDPLIDYMIRKRAVSIYASRLDRTMRYGTFNLDALVQCLYKFSIDDIEDVQDYFDDLTEKFNQKLKAKIKKGKIAIKI